MLPSKLDSVSQQILGVFDEKSMQCESPLPFLITIALCSHPDCLLCVSIFFLKLESGLMEAITSKERQKICFSFDSPDTFCQHAVQKKKNRGFCTLISDLLYPELN